MTTDKYEALKETKQKIRELYSEGLSYRDIQEKLGFKSHNTVAHHIKKMKEQDVFINRIRSQAVYEFAGYLHDIDLSGLNEEERRNALLYRAQTYLGDVSIPVN